ncbi:hypothetical protein KSC_014130 [Ktedonobacter sp. SOSP1-52]|nr:hypothetical protein KSC_014130 [Ktedonobacter sp. SOSP1-52]
MPGSSSTGRLKKAPEAQDLDQVLCFRGLLHIGSTSYVSVFTYVYNKQDEGGHLAISLWDSRS